MSDITEFVLARIAEDEAAAGTIDPALAHEGSQLVRAAIDWLRNDPAGDMSVARALIGVRAKRRILELHRPSRKHRGAEETCATCGFLAPCDTVLLLAMSYADHPAYRQEWRL